MVAVLVAVDSFSTSGLPSDVREVDLLFLSTRSSSSPSESVYVAVKDCNTVAFDIFRLSKGPYKLIFFKDEISQILPEQVFNLVIQTDI